MYKRPKIGVLSTTYHVELIELLMLTKHIYSFETRPIFEMIVDLFLIRNIKLSRLITMNIVPFIDFTNVLN